MIEQKYIAIFVVVFILIIIFIVAYNIYKYFTTDTTIDYSVDLNHYNKDEKIDQEVCYQKLMTEEEIENSKKLLETLYMVANKHDLDISICAGTLLGYIRNKKFIPWDDDIDVVIKKNDLSKLKIVLEELKRDYQIDSNFEYILSTARYKFFKYTDLAPVFFKIFYEKDDNRAKTYHPKYQHYTWPFVDIFIGTKIGTYFEALGGEFACYLNDDHVLKDGKLEGVDIKYIDSEYKSFKEKKLDEICSDSGYRHKTETNIGIKCETVNCGDVLDYSEN